MAGVGSRGVETRKRKSQFVSLFRTTPRGTVCPNFYVLAHANGCTFEPACAYCYLKSSFRSIGRARAFTNAADLKQEVVRWMGRDDLESYVLNTGNLSDSLAFETARPIMGELIDLFEIHAFEAGRPHTLLLVTKAGPGLCDFLLHRRVCPNVVISFSVNSPEAAAQFEPGAAPVETRFEAARRLLAHGWRVRIRVDPMISGFDYGWVAAKVCNLRSERVTLGTLRSEPSLLRYIPTALRRHLDLTDDGAALYRYPYADRRKLYRSMIGRLDGQTEIGLCEETPAMWEEVLGRSDPLCNCGL